jgi:hypothetical protein
MVPFVMPDTPLHRKIAHLSQSQLEALIDQYYARKSVAGLIREFNIDCLPSQLYKLLPPKISAVACPNCGGLMISKRRARTSTNTFQKSTVKCQDCHHHENVDCRCDYCRNKHQQKKNKSDRPVAIKATDLTLEQAVALLSLLNGYSYQNFGNCLRVGPALPPTTPFAPSGDYGEHLIVHLIEVGLLRHNPQSTLPFNFSVRDGMCREQLSNLVGLSNAVTPRFLEELESLITGRNWPLPWFEDVNIVAMNLAVAECKEFYDFCASKRAFPSIASQLIEAVIFNILEDFSPGQCMRIIQSCAQYASDFLVKHSATPKMAANYMLEACQRFVDKARKENWSLQSLTRNVNCPRSMMSIMWYDHILQVSDQGLSKPVALIQLSQ